MTRNIVVLKSPDYGAFAAQHRGNLPYRIDHLRDEGFVLRYSDVLFRWPWNLPSVRRILGRLRGAGAPVLQTISLGSRIVRSPVTLAMFESEGHFLAALRGLIPPLRRRRLVIVACWLAEIAPRLPPAKRRIYRWLYRHVDAVIVFSENQRAILGSALGIPADRITVAAFGIDRDELAPLETAEDGTVLAVGRDAGRDWPTLFAAVDGTGWCLTVACRASQMAGLAPPREVTVVGYVERARYLELLAAASVVVIATKDFAYPTGQSVLLEAMAMGKACVVTGTEAMADYAINGQNCVTVPVGDERALREAIRLLLEDESRRAALGEAASALVSSRCNAAKMWESVGQVVSETVPGGDGTR